MSLLKLVLAPTWAPRLQQYGPVRLLVGVATLVREMLREQRGDPLDTGQRPLPPTLLAQVRLHVAADRLPLRRRHTSGDATIGEKVNVGAGTITCNYDGVNKATTTIEDRAFIGSNSSLVAPVTIGEGATIAAGSVITKDAPAGKLTVARARQSTLEGWKRPVKKPK